MEEYKNERENGSLELSDIQKIAIEEYNNKMENDEFKRKQNFKNYEQNLGKYSDKINKLLLR